MNVKRRLHEGVAAMSSMGVAKREILNCNGDKVS